MLTMFLCKSSAAYIGMKVLNLEINCPVLSDRIFLLMVCRFATTMQD